MSGDPEERRLPTGEGSVPRATSNGGSARAEDDPGYYRSARKRLDFFPRYFPHSQHFSPPFFLPRLGLERSRRRKCK